MKCNVFGKNRIESAKLYFPNLGMITLSVIIVPIYATNNVLIIIKIRFPFVWTFSPQNYFRLNNKLLIPIFRLNIDNKMMFIWTFSPKNVNYY